MARVREETLQQAVTGGVITSAWLVLVGDRVWWPSALARDERGRPAGRAEGEPAPAESS